MALQGLTEAEKETLTTIVGVMGMLGAAFITDPTEDTYNALLEVQKRYSFAFAKAMGQKIIVPN